MIHEAAIPGGARVRVNLRPYSFSVAVDLVEVYTFDATGRPRTSFRDGRFFERGLDGRLVERWKEGEGFAGRRWREWTGAEKDRFFEALARRMEGLAGQAAIPAEAREALRAAAGWDPARLADDAKRFLDVYKPITILPPDQYRSLVLQVTEGCSYNRCAFCDFYRDRVFRAKEAAEVRAHIARVREFFGPALHLRRSVFLADGDAFVLSMERLRPILELVRSEFFGPGSGFDGVYGFLDVFNGRQKSVEAYRQLARLGVRRIYLGVETGHDPLLAFLRKPGSARETIEVVRRIKAAGVAVGVILMVGPGGDRFAGAHVRDTVALVNELPLDGADFVYLSDFVEHAGSDYARRARAEGLAPLSAAGRAAQADALRTGFRFRPGAAPRVGRYEIAGFLYS